MSGFNWDKVNKRERIYERKRYGPDHLCRMCLTPMYSKLPLCHSCFVKNGYTKKQKVLLNINEKEAGVK
jgi:hypothetical protein